MKRLLKRAGVIALLVLFCVPVFANESIQQIEAYLNRDLKVVLNNNQVQFDHNGETLYPIIYQGVTYLPAIALGEKMQLPTSYDRETNTLYIGQVPSALDFIDDLVPYAGDSSVRVSSDQRKERVIAGVTYSHWLQFSYDSKLYYDLGGKYTTLTFKVYSEDDEPLYIYGDNGAELLSYMTVPKQLPTTLTVDVSGVIQLEIEKVQNRNDKRWVYVFDAYIE